MPGAAGTIGKVLLIGGLGVAAVALASRKSAASASQPPGTTTPDNPNTPQDESILGSNDPRDLWYDANGNLIGDVGQPGAYDYWGHPYDGQYPSDAGAVGQVHDPYATDSDGDGFPDAIDAAPLDKNIWTQEQAMSAQEASNKRMIADQVAGQKEAESSYDPYAGMNAVEKYLSTPVGGIVGFLAAGEGIRLISGGAGKVTKKLFAPRTPPITGGLKGVQTKLPIAGEAASAARAVRPPGRFNLLRPRPLVNRFPTRLQPAARGISRVARAGTIAYGGYVAAHNLIDIGQTLRTGNTQFASDAAKRGTGFLSLGVVDMDLQERRFALFGRRVPLIENAKVSDFNLFDAHTWGWGL